MERKSKSQIIQIVIIIILSVLLVVSLGLGASFAWFSNQNTGSVTATMGGKIIIQLQNSDEGADTKTATFVNKNGLLPGTRIESDVNVMVSESNTPCFLRAKIDIAVSPKYPDKQTLSDGSKAYIIETFNKGIQEIIDDTGTIYIESSTLIGTNPELETNPGVYGDVIPAGAKWMLYDGWFYLVGVDQDLSATEPTDIQLVNVCTEKSSILISFVNGEFYLPGVEWGNHLKDCDITFDITAQAVQIFQNKKEGEERPVYHNETLDEALVVFGEALESEIVFYDNGADSGAGPFSIVPTEEIPVGSFVEVPTATYSKGGVPFKCWNTRADGKGTNYYAGDTIKLTPSKRKLYAIFGT